MASTFRPPSSLEAVSTFPIHEDVKRSENRPPSRPSSLTVGLPGVKETSADFVQQNKHHLNSSEVIPLSTSKLQNSKQADHSCPSSKTAKGGKPLAVGSQGYRIKTNSTAITQNSEPLSPQQRSSQDLVSGDLHEGQDKNPRSLSEEESSSESERSIAGIVPGDTTPVSIDNGRDHNKQSTSEDAKMDVHLAELNPTEYAKYHDNLQFLHHERQVDRLVTEESQWDDRLKAPSSLPGCGRYPDNYPHGQLGEMPQMLTLGEVAGVPGRVIKLTENLSKLNENAENLDVSPYCMLPETEAFLLAKDPFRIPSEVEAFFQSKRDGIKDSRKPGITNFADLAASESPMTEGLPTAPKRGKEKEIAHNDTTVNEKKTNATTDCQGFDWRDLRDASDPCKESSGNNKDCQPPLMKLNFDDAHGDVLSRGATRAEIAGFGGSGVTIEQMSCQETTGGPRIVFKVPPVSYRSAPTNRFGQTAGVIGSYNKPAQDHRDATAPKLARGIAAAHTVEGMRDPQGAARSQHNPCHPMFRGSSAFLSARPESGISADATRDVRSPIMMSSFMDSVNFGNKAILQETGQLLSRLSPTAAEFSSVNPEQGKTKTAAPESVFVHIPLGDCVNYRQLLDKSVSCDWSRVIYRIIYGNDQQASLFLQQKMKVGTVEQKHEIVDAVVEEAFALMVHRFGNFVVQRSFEHGTPAQIEGLAQNMQGNIVALSMDAFGCHVAQKALDAVPEPYKVIYVSELLCHIPETVIHRYACHVWQKLFELRWTDSPPEIMKHVNTALKGMWHEVALGETGSLVVQNIFENCLEEDKRPCIREVLKNIDIVAHGQFGNWCIQHICEHGAELDRVQATNHVLHYAAEYSTDQFASKVVEKCLKIGGSDFLDRYLEHVCERREDRPRIPLIDIASDQYGNYLIQYILSQADTQHREMVASHIRKHMVSLRGSKFGSRVALLCSNPSYATRPSSSGYTGGRAGGQGSSARNNPFYRKDRQL